MRGTEANPWPARMGREPTTAGHFGASGPARCHRQVSEPFLAILFLKSFSQSYSFLFIGGSFPTPG